jgi:cell division control protein 7
MQTDRSFCTNVPSVEYGEVPWPELVERINPYLYQRASVPTPTSTSHSPSSPTPRSPPPPTKHNILLSSALDLLTKCLDWDATRRITAREALFHPFLAEGTEVRLDPLTGEDYSGDDLFFPHPIGEGVCRRGHWTEGDAHFVRLEGKKYHELMPGEGIAIGLDSCEFHTDGTWLQPGGDEL